MKDKFQWKRGYSEVKMEEKIKELTTDKFSVGDSKETRVATYHDVDYKANDDNIVKVETEYDQYHEEMWSISKIVMSKEAFVEAYNKYIKGEKDE